MLFRSLQKDSPLTACIDKALAAMTDSGELQQIQDQWMGADTAPIIE